ncbi:MAG: hypothetical protein JW768_10945 [Chitinispirillaceae bacterium]|nr:hypothetical protein [Chitinispirillaceae bacterium]
MKTGMHIARIQTLCSAVLFLACFSISHKGMYSPSSDNNVAPARASDTSSVIDSCQGSIFIASIPPAAGGKREVFAAPAIY